MTGNLNLVFYDGKAAENRMIFPASVFLIIDVFPPHLEKESSNFSPRVSNPPFQYTDEARKQTATIVIFRARLRDKALLWYQDLTADVRGN